jgi:anaerobic magnesium-protoporphyrin IX monomethyl ester cyclase
MTTCKGKITERRGGVIDAARHPVVLINPPSDRIVEEYDAPSYGHLGIAYLAGALRGCGLPCKIVDAKLERMNYADTIEYVARLEPCVIGITSFTHEINLVARLSSDIKKRLPVARIVIGGVHASSLPAETLKNLKAVDYLIEGEGELTFPALVEAVLNKSENTLRGMAGIAYRDNGSVKITGHAAWAEDLDTIHFPAWDMFDRKVKSFPVITSRGCPYKCVFCARMMGERVRTRSAQNVISELELINGKFKGSEVYFYDETFGFYKDWLGRFIDLMAKSGLNKKISWGITTRAHLLNEKTVRAMKSAGCMKIDFGVESGDDGILKIIKKGETKEDFIRAAEVLKKCKMKSHSYYIIGHPYETRQTALNTINFAASLNTDIISIGIMIPYPGTEVARLASRGEGGYKKISADWADYNKQLGNALEMEGLSGADMTRLQLLGYLKFYIKNLKISAFMGAAWRYRKLILAIIAKYIKSLKETLTR